MALGRGLSIGYGWVLIVMALGGFNSRSEQLGSLWSSLGLWEKA